MNKLALSFTSPVPSLETPRLILRIDTAEQYFRAFGTFSDNALKDYFGIPNDEQLNTERAKVVGGMVTYRTSILFFHLILKTTNQVVGSFAYHNWYPAHRRSEIGYAMKAAAYKNRGYMKEALPSILSFGFEQMDLNRIEAFIHPGNIPSRRLVEAVGFRQEGLLRAHYTHNGDTGDSLVYGLLKKEYAGKKEGLPD